MDAFLTVVETVVERPARSPQVPRSRSQPQRGGARRRRFGKYVGLDAAPRVEPGPTVSASIRGDSGFSPAMRDALTGGHPGGRRRLLAASSWTLQPADPGEMDPSHLRHPVHGIFLPQLREVAARGLMS